MPESIQNMLEMGAQGASSDLKATRRKKNGKETLEPEELNEESGGKKEKRKARLESKSIAEKDEEARISHEKAKDQEEQDIQEALLAAEREREGLISLYSDLEPETRDWMIDYLGKIKRGKLRDKMFTGAKGIIEGVAIPAEAAAALNDFVGTKFEINNPWDGKKDKIFNLGALETAMGCSANEAAQIVAFVSLLENAYDTRRVLKALEQGKNNTLESHDFTPEEAQALKAVVKNEEHFKRIVNKSFEVAAPLLRDHISAEALLKILPSNARYTDGAAVNFELVQKYCKTERNKNAIKEHLKTRSHEADGSLNQHSLNSKLHNAEKYEVLFGPLTKDEFLEIFPDWEQASIFYSRHFLERFGLRDPVKAPSKPREAAKPSRAVVEKKPAVKSDEGKEAAAEEVAKAIIGYVKGKQSREMASLNRQQEKVEQAQQGKKNYEASLKEALHEMDKQESSSERTKIFLEKIWSQYLTAVAQGKATREMRAVVRSATEELAGELGKDFGQLLEICESLEDGKNETEATALIARIRHSQELRNQQVVVEHRIVPLQKEKGLLFKKKVNGKTLALKAYAIDGMYRGVTILGECLTNTGTEDKRLGVAFDGTEIGAVIAANVKKEGNRGAVALASPDTVVTIPEGAEAHPINELLVQAAQKDAAAVRMPTSANEMPVAIRLAAARAETAGRLAGSGADAVTARELGYFASLSATTETGEPEAPFLELVSIIKRRLDADDPIGGLSEALGEDQAAIEKVLLKIAREIGAAGVTGDSLRNNPVDACAELLEKVMGKSGLDIKGIAEKLFTEEAGLVTGGREVIQTREKVRGMQKQRLHKSVGKAVFGALLSLMAAGGVKAGYDSISKTANPEGSMLLTSDPRTPVERDSKASVIPEDPENKLRTIEAEEKERQAKFRALEKKALTKTGLWGLVEQRLANNGIGYDDIVKMRTYAYPEGKKFEDLTPEEKRIVHSGYVDHYVQAAGYILQKSGEFGLLTDKQAEDAYIKQAGGWDWQGVDKLMLKDLEEWEKTITPAKADKILDYLQQSGGDFLQSAYWDFPRTNNTKE